MPVIFSNILFVTAHSQESTFMVQQARSMYRRVGRHFEIPAGSYLVFGYLTVMIFLPLYDRVLIPIARKYTGKERGITVLQRIGVGLFILVIGMLVAAGVEHRRRHRVLASGILQHAHAHLDMSAFWLVPQFCLLGLADVFVSVGNLELFYDQFPESMRSIGSALFAGSHALGSYASTFLVSLLQGGQRRDAHHHRRGWFADDRTLGHLDDFYWLLAGLSIFNFLVFQICARWYIYKAAATDSNSDIAPHEAIDPHKLEIEAQSAI
ncbi:hypothetical protein O6H91_19G026200 [Diphasiastrum complanatum]|nr:hypothetical protein O6H91_19G026200 [Diphasiastrum complanatum]